MSLAISFIRPCADPEEIARRAAALFLDVTRSAVKQRGRCSVALAGGSTPRRTYELLAGLPVAWERVHLFWGDERCVPPDHPDSNFGMVQQALLERVRLPPENIYRMPGEMPPPQAAKSYTQELRRFFRANPSLPGFDLVFLGLGEDGHTASLFPGSPALQLQEAWVAVVEHEQPPPPLVTRLSLTLPVLNAARQVVFLVNGANKAPVVRRLFAPTSEEAAAGPLPAAQVLPAAGKLTWLVEAAALAELFR